MALSILARGAQRTATTSPPVPRFPVPPLLSGHFAPCIGHWPFSAHTLRCAVRSCVQSASRPASCSFVRSASRSAPRSASQPAPPVPHHPIFPLLPGHLAPSIGHWSFNAHAFSFRLVGAFLAVALIAARCAACCVVCCCAAPCAACCLDPACRPRILKLDQKSKVKKKKASNV